MNGELQVLFILTLVLCILVLSCENEALLTSSNAKKSTQKKLTETFTVISLGIISMAQFQKPLDASHQL